MPHAEQPNPILAKRTARHWSQAELARRAGISRAAVSAIETKRLTPSVAAALSIAAALDCSVEELFACTNRSSPTDPSWAWTPELAPSRYWEAEVFQQHLLYPVEAVGLNAVPHDGVAKQIELVETGRAPAETTLTIACCDPAASLLAAEYSRMSGFRLLLFPRSGAAALKLLQQRRVHIAGLHRSTATHPERNAESVRALLGPHHSLLRAAQWEEGIAIPPANQSRSPKSILAATRLWALREPGSGARECLDELLAGRRCHGREVDGHHAVAESVRSGWAGAGVCVKFSAVEARLNFLPVRTETVDFCFPTELQHDPRIHALIRLLRSRNYRRIISELPGYDARHTGELCKV